MTKTPSIEELESRAAALRRTLRWRLWLGPRQRVLNAARAVKRQVRYRSQLALRGWADEDIWNLDVALSRRTAEMLAAFARSDGYLAKNGDPVGEEGEELLRHVNALRLYGNPGPWAWDLHSAEDQKKVTTDAQAAFRYIAEQLPGLWT